MNVWFFFSTEAAGSSPSGRARESSQFKNTDHRHAAVRDRAFQLIAFVADGVHLVLDVLVWRQGHAKNAVSALRDCLRRRGCCHWFLLSSFSLLLFGRYFPRRSFFAPRPPSL